MEKKLEASSSWRFLFLSHFRSLSLSRAPFPFVEPPVSPGISANFFDLGTKDRLGRLHSDRRRAKLFRTRIPSPSPSALEKKSPPPPPPYRLVVDPDPDSKKLAYNNHAGRQAPDAPGGRHPRRRRHRLAPLQRRSRLRYPAHCGPRARLARPRLGRSLGLRARGRRASDPARPRRCRVLRGRAPEDRGGGHQDRRAAAAPLHLVA